MNLNLSQEREKRMLLLVLFPVILLKQIEFTQFQLILLLLVETGLDTIVQKTNIVLFLLLQMFHLKLEMRSYMLQIQELRLLVDYLPLVILQKFKVVRTRSNYTHLVHLLKQIYQLTSLLHLQLQVDTILFLQLKELEISSLQDQ